MSGGSFNYLADNIEDNPILLSNIDMLAKMAEWLEENGKGEPAKEMRRIHKKVDAIADELADLFRYESPLYKLIHDVEWWASHDIGEEDFDKTWSKYKNSKRVKSAPRHRLTR